MARDTRLVQTAVIGDEHSDVPVVLPPEAIELDQFRHVHEHDTFWCGLLLGGCGAQLTTKLYLDRQCHFSHFPLPDGVPQVCRRPAVGEASADHLYVKGALSQWLLEHGRSAHFSFPAPMGSLIDVDTDDGASLRVHMDGAVPPDWSAGRTVLLGPGVILDPNVLTGCPYVNRVRCETDGSGRRVWIACGHRQVDPNGQPASATSTSPRGGTPLGVFGGGELGSFGQPGSGPLGERDQANPSKGGIPGCNPHLDADQPRTACGATSIDP